MPPRIWYVPLKNHVDQASMIRNWTDLENYLISLRLREEGPIAGGESSSGGTPGGSDGYAGDVVYTTTSIWLNIDGTMTEVFVKYTDTEAAAKIAADDLYVQNAGDTMTGLLTLSGDPTVALHAASKRYVDLSMSPLSGTWLFNTATTATPGAGEIQFDNAIAGSVTNVYINQTGDRSIDRTILTGLIANTDTFLLAAVETPGEVIQFTASGAPSVSAGVVTVPVTYVDHDGTVPWALGDIVVLGVR